MLFPAGQRIFTCSSITGEELECFIAAPINKLKFDLPIADVVTDAPKNPQTGLILSFAAIVASRGRILLSSEILERTRSFMRLVGNWPTKPLSMTTICELHAQLMGKNNRQSQFRDSIVWVDGLRPGDAKLIPGPASGVQPALQDYFDFLARNDIPDWVKLAIGHFQLLVIHPFFDGNGRLGRAISLIHAQRFLGIAQAYAVAAALSLHRRALRPLLEEVQHADLTNYLNYWRKLISWSADCVARLAYMRERAQEDVRVAVGKRHIPERMIAFLLDNPIFSAADMVGRLSLSKRLVSLHMLSLEKTGIIEEHRESNHERYYRCSIAIRFWQQSCEATASTSVKLLVPDNATEATSPTL